MKTLATVLVLAGALGNHAFAQAATATFDDLPALPATNAATGLYFANNSSDSYAGVMWDSRFTVAGDQYRVDTTTPGPLFGIPHSGRYFVTNDSPNNDGLLISTARVLTGAWFGRNEYYGFGAGADQVTINAMGGATVLKSVVFDLPTSPAGQPGSLGFADTSVFAALSGITGYRIDRHEIGTLTGNWVADDFSFAAAPVPEPESYAMLLAGLGIVAWMRRRGA